MKPADSVEPRRSRRRLTAVGALTALILPIGGTVSEASARRAPEAVSGPTTVTFVANGTSEQKWTVPVGVDSVQYDVYGAGESPGFGGSAARLVMHALSSKKSSAAELAEIRRTLDEMEGRLG